MDDHHEDGEEPVLAHHEDGEDGGLSLESKELLEEVSARRLTQGFPTPFFLSSTSKQFTIVFVRIGKQPLAIRDNSLC